ncbi:hypothetical protein KAR52_01470 [Candidatus Pacearchaeota archaeon]|nr:hypothetical protein [Candidatus Pacearchaeota archaeon]
MKKEKQFKKVIAHLEKKLDESELEYTCGQIPKDALWYNGMLKIPAEHSFSEGIYIFDGKNRRYFCFNDELKFIGINENEKFKDMSFGKLNKYMKKEIY